MRIDKVQADLVAMSKIKTSSKTSPRTRREQEEKDIVM